MPCRGCGVPFFRKKKDSIFSDADSAGIANRFHLDVESDNYLIYAYESHHKLMIKNRLKLTTRKEGGVNIYKACWQAKAESIHQVAPAFVVYADLLHAQDPRCEEAAERLYENNIQAMLA